jgi:hypothetical protein
MNQETLPGKVGLDNDYSHDMLLCVLAFLYKNEYESPLDSCGGMIKNAHVYLAALGFDIPGLSQASVNGFCHSASTLLPTSTRRPRDDGATTTTLSAALKLVYGDT